MAAGFYSDGNRYTDEFISNYIDIYVKDAIKRIQGVADVQIFGERKYSMRLWLDPARLAARGLTASRCGLGAAAAERADRLRPGGRRADRDQRRCTRSACARWDA